MFTNVFIKCYNFRFGVQCFSGTRGGGDAISGGFREISGGECDMILYSGGWISMFSKFIIPRFGLQCFNLSRVVDAISSDTLGALWGWLARRG